MSFRRLVSFLGFFLMLSLSVSGQTPSGSAITFQGVLKASGEPSTGVFDLSFELFDAENGGSQIVGPVVVEDVIVNAGVFTVHLDFGSAAFVGDARWVEIGVRPGDSTGAFTTLYPRQELTPTPYALDAGTLGGHSPDFFRDAGNINAGILGTDYFDAREDLAAEGHLGDAPGDIARNNGTLQETLNSDLLDGHHGSFFRNASSLNSGSVDFSLFSAYGDLAAEGYLDDNAPSDLLTRNQASSHFVNEGQGNSITSNMIVNYQVQLNDIGADGAPDNGYLLSVNDGRLVWQPPPTPSSPGGIRGTTEFTADGTWTAPADVHTVLVEAWGAGGGGGGGADRRDEAMDGGSGGGGGGGGAYVRSVIQVVPGTTYTIDIGGGGSGGAAGTNHGDGSPGTPGAPTRIRSGTTNLLVAPGGENGEGGVGSALPGAGGLGGIAGSGDILRAGGDGTAGKKGGHGPLPLQLPYVGSGGQGGSSINGSLPALGAEGGDGGAGGIFDDAENGKPGEDGQIILLW